MFEIFEDEEGWPAPFLSNCQKAAFFYSALFPFKLTAIKPTTNG
jgi:hypothetical protein